MRTISKCTFAIYSVKILKRLLFVVATVIFFSPYCNAQVIVTFAGMGFTGFTGDGGPATAAKVLTPSGITVDHGGNVYFTDQNANCVRKVDVAGIITSITGNSGTGVFGGDGGLATAATLHFPQGLAFDDTNNLYIADQFDNVVRKVNAVTGIITTVAGNNALIGYTGDNGPATAAALWHPADVAIDHSGNIYIIDQDNSAVRKVSQVTGLITTMAGDGTAGYSGDGGIATAAELNFPQGIAVDSYNVYIADFYNNCVRKVNIATDTITTVAGNGTSGYSGDGSPATGATLDEVSAVAIDDTGNIYISDYFNNRIRKVNATTHIITTIAGIGTIGYCCDCYLARTAEISYIEGVAVDKKGNVYLANFGDGRVTKITDNAPCPVLHIKDETTPVFKIFPNPSDGQFSILMNEDSHGRLAIYNALGEKVYEATVHSSETDLNLSYLSTGVYTLHLDLEKSNIVEKLIISH